MPASPSRSLDRLEHDAEQNRAILVDTVDTLRVSVLGEIEDMRRRVSFDHIGTEIRSRIRANPLRSFAIGAGLTVPLWQLGRRIPLPLVLIGAGVALARPAAKNAVAGAAGGASASVERFRTRSADALSSAWDGAKGVGTQIGQQISAGLDAANQSVRETKNDAVARASDMLDAGNETVSSLAAKGATLLHGGSDQLADARDHAGRKVTQTRAQVVDLFYDNPLLVAGAGLVLGALVAAIVPATETEGQLLEKVAPELKQKASDLVDTGYEAVRDAAEGVYDGAVGRAQEQGLSPEGAKSAASELGGRLGAVVDAAAGQHGYEKSNNTPETNS